MKKSLYKNEWLQIAIVFVVMYLVPMVLSMFFGYNTLGGYFAPIVLLIFTWWLYKRQGKTLRELGLNFTSSNLKLLPIGLLIGILFSTSLLLLQAWNNGLSIHFNKHADWLLVFAGLFVFLQGVLNEELIFRGYCFKTTVEKVGVTKANILFAFVFVVWHWISFNAWGNIAMMLGLFTTAFGHWMFSTSLLKSGTLYLPIGIHLGNNWAGKHLYATGMESALHDTPVHDALFYVSATQSIDNSILHTLSNYGLTVACMLLFIWIVWKWPWNNSIFNK